jgi:hypothetical protein
LQGDDEICLRFDLATSFRLEESTVELVFTAAFFKKETEETLIEIKTSNVFAIL